MKLCDINEKAAVMAAVCGIDIGGQRSIEVARWISGSGVMLKLSKESRGNVSRHIMRAVKAANKKGEKFKEASAWTPFAEQAATCEDDLAGKEMLTAPSNIAALAIFYAANVGGEAATVIDEMPWLIESIPGEDIKDLLAEGIAHNQEFLQKYIEPVNKGTDQYGKKSSSIWMNELYDAIAMLDAKRTEEMLLCSEFPSIMVMTISKTPLFGTLLSMVESFGPKMSDVILSFDGGDIRALVFGGGD